MSRSIVVLLAAAIGLLAANLYYAQPLIAVIAPSLGIAPEAAGLVVTLTQIGYGSGLLLAVPLSDLFENKRLTTAMIAIAVTGLLGLAFVQSATTYFIAAFMTGFGASTVQIIVPYAAHFVQEERRGKLVGQLMSGLMLGIMLSRPTASFLTDLFSWHAVFIASACALVLLAITLALLMEERRPVAAGVSYAGLLRSMGRLFLTTPVLRQRAFIQGSIFGAFCLFWTAAPLLLASPTFGLSQSGIAVFALVGVAGAVSAPMAGIAADRGHARIATTVGLLCGSLAFAIVYITPTTPWLGIVLLAIGAILVDAGVSANLVLGQRAIFALAPEQRGRLNSLYIATAFIGGASGSAIGAWSYATGDWPLTAALGFAMPAVALVFHRLRA